MKIKATAFLSIGLFMIALVSFAFNAGAANQPEAVNSVVDTKLTTAEMSGTYEFGKPHTTIGFRVMHFGLTEVPGSFRDYTGTINYDAADLAKSSVQFTAKIASIDTGIAARDTHLKSADFFDAEKFPELSFKSTKIEKKGNGIIATGDFTIKGVTKQISLPFQITGVVKDGQGGILMGASAQTVINRQDYGVSWNKTLDNGTLVLDNNVKVDLQIEAAKQQPKTETVK
ncbi:MAG: YceI family protein [Pyrinomonadaceae bacterium]